MFNRILASLDSPRRHLAFLVSLLVLVFALSGVVAYRAMEAERSRSAAVEGVIERGIDRAVGEWASLYHRGTGTVLSFVGTAVVDPLARSGGLSASTVLERTQRRLLCDFCRDTLHVGHVYDIDVLGRRVHSSTAPFDTALAMRALDVLAADRSGLFTDSIHGIVNHGLSAGDLTITFLIGLTTPSGRLHRAIGLVLTSESADDVLSSTYDIAQQLSGTTSLVDHADSLFNNAAFVEGQRVLGGEIPDASRNSPAAPVHGLSFAVGLRQSYAEGAYDSATKLIAIIGLLVLIGGLLVIAAVQIRRETVLMRMRADFVSSVSHELRTPLAQIRMFVETLLLGRTRTDLERQRSLEIIEQEARRLSHLVENVLLFSKTEGGRRPRIAPEPVDFAGDIRRAVDSFTLLSRAREAELRTELQENITVQVDRGALRQILVNLIDNALKYGPAGQRVTVGAALFDDVARVWVDDEGPGIPEESRGRVFESFYRLPRERQKHVAGSGIGLSVVRELARLHGGDVWAEDAPGGGARIVVQFPDAYVRSESAGAMAAAS